LKLVRPFYNPLPIQRLPYPFTLSRHHSSLFPYKPYHSYSPSSILLPPSSNPAFTFPNLPFSPSSTLFPSNPRPSHSPFRTSYTLHPTITLPILPLSPPFTPFPSNPSHYPPLSLPTFTLMSRSYLIKKSAKAPSQLSKPFWTFVTLQH